MAIIKISPPISICLLPTIYRHYTIFKYCGVVPVEGKYGINGGRPKRIANSDLNLLKYPLQTVGYTEGMSRLQDSMSNTIQKKVKLRGVIKVTKTLCKAIFSPYHKRGALHDKIISLVKTIYSMNKTSRRKMPPTSVCNLMSHIGTVAYSNFSPCVKRWYGYYKVSKGIHKYMNII